MMSVSHLSKVSWVGIFKYKLWLYFFFFFFQAEDGIRDIGVTGVQTCALPIWSRLQGRLADGNRVQRREPGQRPRLRHDRPPPRPEGDLERAPGHERRRPAGRRDRKSVV